MERCSKHTEREAVGRCISCGRNLCDECLAQEKGGKLLCYDCAVKGTLDDFDRKEEKGRAIAAARKVRAKKAAREGVSGFTLFVIVGVAVILLQGGVILADYLLQKPGDTSFIWSNVIKVRYERDRCADNLHRLSGMMEAYRKDHGGLPRDLTDLGDTGDGSVFRCPATGQPYAYDSGGGSYTLTCPSPGAHDLLFLFDRDGKLSWRKAEERP
jgi:hypothetical protein